MRRNLGFRGRSDTGYQNVDQPSGSLQAVGSRAEFSRTRKREHQVAGIEISANVPTFNGSLNQP